MSASFKISIFWGNYVPPYPPPSGGIDHIKGVMGDSVPPIIYFNFILKNILFFIIIKNMTDCINLFQYASSIRHTNENWKDCIKRASAQAKAEGMKFCRPKQKEGTVRKQKVYRGKTKSECHGLSQDDCEEPCGWVKESKVDKTGKKKSAHCALKRVGAKALSAESFPEW
jgi:hypothetical protein